jgi:UDP-N-acetylmuramyl pentapeptide phosphotransferase/UDP-N-acetylglucosamine-1-phosphate transferase
MYPFCIRLLRYLHIKKTIRLNSITGEESAIFVKLHGHKSGTPTMGGVMFLIVMAIFMILSFVAKDY